MVYFLGNIRSFTQKLKNSSGESSMATIIYDNETTFDALKDRTIAIMGYGSQGHAHALNLHESGLNVIVGLRNGSPSWAKAEKPIQYIIPNGR